MSLRERLSPPSTLMALTMAAWAKSLKPEPLVASVSSTSSMPKRVSGLSTPKRRMASSQVMRLKGVAISLPKTSLKRRATRFSARVMTSSSRTKLSSMSTWVNSGWRSARRSSSRKQRTIWKYFSKPETMSSCLKSWGDWGRA